MRCDASDEYVGAVASPAIGAADPDPCAAATSTAATSSIAAAIALTKRRTRFGVEQVSLRDLDGERNLILEAETHRFARRQRGDEVRPRSSHALAVALLLDRVLHATGAAADRVRVELEVRHRRRPGRLDEWQRRAERRQVGPRRREVKVVAADPEDDAPSCVVADAGVALQRLIVELDALPGERDRDRAVLRRDLRLDEVHRR